MLFIIDGDNAPGTRTRGIEFLAKEDRVIICSVITNKYYQSEVNMEKLRDTTKAVIQCAAAPLKKQSADFLMAMKAQEAILKGEKELYIVSGDTHAETIREILAQEYQEQGVIIKKVADIYEGIFSDLGRIQSLDRVAELLQYQFGDEEGRKLYQRIHQLVFQQFQERMSNTEPLRCRVKLSDYRSGEVARIKS